MISTPYGSFFYGRFVNKRNAEKRKNPGRTGALQKRYQDYLAVDEPEGHGDNYKERNLLDDDNFAISHR